MKGLYLIFIIVMLTGFNSAAQSPDQYTFNLLPTAQQAANVTSNSTNFWDTNIGTLSGVNITQFAQTAGILFIQDAFLSSFGNAIWCQLIGCTMTGDIDMSNNNIVGVLDLNATRINTTNITADFGNFTDLFVSNSTLTIGNVSISSFNDVLQIENGATINASFLTGDGSGLFNVPFNITNGSASFQNITLGGVIITNWSDVNYTVANASVITAIGSFSGSFSTILPENFNFEIAQIIVEPSTSTGSFRFSMFDVNTGDTIDADLQAHQSTWNIFKSFPLNGPVSLNFTGVSPAKSFTVTIKYFTNVPS